MTALKTYLLSLGALGLFALALLDSAFVPIPGGVDFILLLLSVMRPPRLPFYVLSASAGSAIGCLILHGIAARGGDLVLKKFGSRRRQQVHDAISRYEFWALFFAALLPPPFPTKLFVLTAGILKMDRFKLVASVWLGRLVRYSIVGYLAIRYGERATLLIRQHSWKILVGVLVLLAAATAWVWFKHRRIATSAGLT